MFNNNLHKSDYKALKDAYETSCLDFKNPSHSFSHLMRRADELLRGIKFAGKDILEVGAGNGFFSHYLAVCRKANFVVSLDEYEGKGSVLENYDFNLRMQSILRDEKKVELIKSDFLNFRSDKIFDFIFFVNVIHHIVVTEKMLSKDTEKFELAARVFAFSFELLKPGGTIVVQDVDKLNVCPIPKYRRMMSDVNRKTKQKAREWIKAMKMGGFSEISIRFRFPLNLPNVKVLRPLLNNYIASVLTDSSYIIMGKKINF